MKIEKSITERFCHALLFEVLAIAICAPLGAWLLGYPLAHMGALTLMVSLVAMVWNMLFNALFDQAQRRMGFQRNVAARAVHAVLFEVGLILAWCPWRHGGWTSAYGMPWCWTSALRCSFCPTPLPLTGFMTT